MKSLLQLQNHRQWPLPNGPWVMHQIWHQLLFAHGPIAQDVLRRLIPPALEIDLFENTAWIGVVPFRMSQVSLRGTPSLPKVSAFPELNVRTYVSTQSKAGQGKPEIHSPTLAGAPWRRYRVRLGERSLTSAFVRYLRFFGTKL
jgi:uncharacterized protein YqjF (DUF2071 family)